MALSGNMYKWCFDDFMVILGIFWDLERRLFLEENPYSSFHKLSLPVLLILFIVSESRLDQVE